MILALFVTVSLGLSKPDYKKKEGKQCTFCHPAGKYYQEHNHSLEGYKASGKK